MRRRRRNVRQLNRRKDGRRAPTFFAFLSRTSFIAGSLAFMRGTLES